MFMINTGSRLALTFALIPHSKFVFEKLFWLKLLSKKLHYMHLTLKYLIATKDHVFLNKPTPLSSGVFSKYVKPFLPLGIQGLTN